MAAGDIDGRRTDLHQKIGVLRARIADGLQPASSLDTEELHRRKFYSVEDQSGSEERKIQCRLEGGSSRSVPKQVIPAYLLIQPAHRGELLVPP